MFLYVFVDILIILTVLKLLIQEWSVTVKETALFIIFAFIQGVLFEYIGVFTAFFNFGCLFFVIHQRKKYSVKKSLILASSTMIITVLCNHVASFLINIIFSIDFSVRVLLIYHLPTYAALSIGFSLLLVKLTKKLRVRVNQNEHLQIALMIIGILVLLSFYGNIILGIFLGNTIELIQLNLLFFVVYMIISIIIFYFYAKTLRERYEMQRHKDEQENLQRYTKEIEFQYTEMRKFKHDYQNILSSLDSFIDEEDFEGLKNYYSEKIKVTSEIMNEHLFQLEGLSKIEVREIKSILAMKLMRAQELGIDVIFEAVDAIKTIAADSIVLVRTLGILLDNAIEELLELNDGKLLVGILKNERSTTFIVQNTCRNDIPKVHKLKQQGFSTKGDGRGIGLSNLSEFTKAHSNISIETTIAGNQFIQKIIIGG